MPEFQSLANKWLTVRKNVILTNTIDPAIAALDNWYETFGVRAEISSGLRDARKQLKIIQELALTNHVQDDYPNIQWATLDEMIVFNGKTIYAWAIGWSRLLQLGVIVNPPKPAKTLFEYNRRDPATGELRLYRPAGYQIGASPHFTGTAFDVSGGANGRIEEELRPIHAAIQSGTIPDLLRYLPEHDNNAIHCDCAPADENKNAPSV